MPSEWKIITSSIQEKHGPVEVLDLSVPCDVLGCDLFACNTIRIPLGSEHFMVLHTCAAHALEALKTSKIVQKEENE